MSKRKSTFLDEVAQQRYAVQSRQPHATPTKEPNPWCPRCRWRTYPLWGEHKCHAPADEARIRRHAGNVMANLHFYRFQPKDQVAVLCFALGHVIGCNQRKGEELFEGLVPLIQQLIREQRGHHPSGAVAAVNRPLKAKKRRV